MSEARIIIPDNLKIYLEAECCDDFNMSRYVVTKDQKNVIAEILRVKNLSEEMRKMGLTYMNTTLLYGPPGMGKTTFGRYLAYYLDMDFVYINFAKLFDGVLGQTTSIISDIFNFIAEQKCIFMMDEIDCISQKRGTESAVTGGEISRITITIMQSLDILRKKKVNSIIIGATNRVDIMDPALKSRFSIVRKLGGMTSKEKQEYIMLFLNDVKVPFQPENIRKYADENIMTSQREVEADIIRCIAAWIENGKNDFILNHIKEEL